MADITDRLTPGGDRVLELAAAEARRYGRPALGAEHLPLGVAEHAEGTGARVLRQRGVTAGQLRAAVEALTGHHPWGDAADVPLNARARRVLALADDEARALGHRRVGSGHILLGLVREGGGIPAGILASLGVHNPAHLRAVVAVLDQPPLL